MPLLPSLLPGKAEGPPAWAHPQANREVVLGGQRVAYLFQRGQRKTIGFSVGAEGLRVRAPRLTPLAAVEAALHTKSDWVLRKLAQVTHQHAALQSARMVWAEGASLAWLGQPLTLRLGSPPTGEPGAVAQAGQPAAPPSRRPSRQVMVQLLGDELWVGLPATTATATVTTTTATASPEPLRHAVQLWMMQAAQAHFVQRLHHYAPLLGVRWSQLRLSSARTRWGSAKADGSIRLHWRLMQCAPEVVDYVVAHELSHLHHMDHSPRFWQTVATVVPDHASLRARLRSERLPPW